MRRLVCSALFLMAATAFTAAQPPAPPPAIPFIITNPDDEDGEAVPILNAAAPFVAGTYPPNLIDGKNIYVRIVDENGKIIVDEKATAKDGGFIWEGGKALSPKNPVFVFAYHGATVTNSVKCDLK